ncbi:RNA recognition motif domain-containing protein [Mucilaginibacter lacusdianchii]|uniref:RNA recognition motif domain-containing protein n=1 Tax=Mucilaginibacter lacusdianchii TaxID=2684211 RepID=UPI00131C5AF8|nr:RNA-binding protein [Mucilaginibacter sp. JXJ CY 39]
MIKLFVGGFPLDITEMTLAKLFSPHGTVSTIKIVRDRKTGTCKGYAFIEMATEEDALNVIAALDGTPMGDRNLNVKISEEKPAAPIRAPKRSFGGTNSFSKGPRRESDTANKRPRRPRM